MKKNNLIRFLILTLAISLLLPIGTIYGANELKLKQTGGSVTIEGNKSAKVNIEITNTSDSKVTGLVAKINASELPNAPFSDTEINIGALESKQSTTASWNINTTDLSFGKTYRLPVVVTSAEGYTATMDAVIYVFTDDGTSSEEKVSKANISITPMSGTLKAGTNTSLTVNVTNTGNTVLNNLVVSLSTLPEGITINNANLFTNIGSLTSNKSNSISVPITINRSIESGSYAFTATVTGTDSEKKAISFTQTSYINIGSSALGTNANLSVTNFIVPTEAKAGASFDAKFTVKNSSTADVKNLKVTVKGGEGLINKTKSIFTESSFTGGSSKEYTVTFFSLEKIDSNNIPIEVSVEYHEDGVKEPITFSQYEGVFINGEGGNGSIKTPQLIVNGYNYGGDAVKAGDEFTLTYTLYNTSSDKSLRNVKIALSSDEGTFIPVGSSNTMYIESIGTKKASSKSIVLNCKPDAAQKTIAITLDMTYEDTKGNEYTAKEVISIPVVQKTKLKLDQISLPYESYVGQPTSLSINFYNVGKTTLNNLTATAEGNFDTPQSPSYFAGNMEPGKQDSYDFSLIPKSVGQVEGKIIFTYEDGHGQIQTVEEPFSFMVIEPPPIDEGDMDLPVEKPGMKTWQKFSLGAGILVAIGIVIFVLRHKKKKKEQELTIDEE